MSVYKTPIFIMCAAIHYLEGFEFTNPNRPRNIKTGVVVCGHNHAACIAIFCNLTGKTGGEYNQGFVTSDNRFVDRRETADIAFYAGQTTKLLTQLYSEDLYTK